MLNSVYYFSFRIICLYTFLIPFIYNVVGIENYIILLVIFIVSIIQMKKYEEKNKENRLNKSSEK
jgi:uncharacterized membrane protein YhaH (DUF805 family)